MLPDPSRVAAAALRFLPRKSISRALGTLARVPAPDPVLQRIMDVYCQAYGVDLSECVVPEQGFGSFDAFFTRTLVPGVRPLDTDARAVLSPADGRIEAAGAIDADARLEIKGSSYTVAELLGDDEATEALQEGYYFVVYLSPRDYHRVHAPVSGEVSRVHHVPGTLYPVNDIGVRHVRKLFATNERVAIHQDSELHGSTATIMVGAIGVGRISLSFDPSVVSNAGIEAGRRVYGDGERPAMPRGGELGMFHLGSTAIVFVRPPFKCEFVADLGQAVRMGEAVLREVAP